MTGILTLFASLIVLFGVLIVLVYTKQLSACRAARRSQEQLNRIEQKFFDMSETQEKIQKKLDQLSTDVLQREIYQNANDRHQKAIKSAKAGRSIDELMLAHGLSSDEASLIMDLHANSIRKVEKSVRENANLGVPVSADLS